MLSMGNAMSQETDSNDEDEMDVTMRLMGNAEAELPDAVTKTITLPDAVLLHNAESPAVAASKHGMTTATANKPGREEDLEKADAAREQTRRRMTGKRTAAQKTGLNRHPGRKIRVRQVDHRAKTRPQIPVLDATILPGIEREILLPGRLR